MRFVYVLGWQLKYIGFCPSAFQRVTVIIGQSIGGPLVLRSFGTSRAVLFTKPSCKPYSFGKVRC